MSENKSLISLVEESNRLEELLLGSGGVITEEIEKALLVQEKSLADKASGYNFVLERLEHLEAYYKEKAQELSKIARQCAAAQDKLKDNLRSAMERMNVDEIQGDDVRFKLQNSKPSLEITDLNLIPKDYKFQVISEEIDKKKILEDLDHGPVPGAKLKQSKYVKPYLNTPKKAGKK